ncbi:hypothetical protein SpCBS45565_g04834 [Spizellomyces sp. 'palustris']|nr:hypothetical protein SpCBS45565_g04834 [Spizellomyces sp. 'palustris']
MPPWRGILGWAVWPLLLGWVNGQEVKSVSVLMKPLFYDSTADELNQLISLKNQFFQSTGIDIRFDLQPSQTADPGDYYAFVQPFLAKSDPTYDLIALDVSWLEEWPGAFFNLFTWGPETGQAQIGQLISDRVSEQYAGIVNSDAVKGNLVALPMWTDYGVIYARTDLLAKYNVTMPTSLDDMAAACETIWPAELASHRSLLCFVAGFQGFDIVELFSELFMTVSPSGGDLLKFGHQVAINTPQNQGVLTELLEWISKGYIAQKTLSFTGTKALQTWLTGDAIFYRGSTSAAKRTSDAFAGKGWTYKVISGNSPGAANPLVSVRGGYHLAMTRAGGHLNDTQVIQALLFLTGAVVQQARAATFGAPPTLKALYNGMWVILRVDLATTLIFEDNFQIQQFVALAAAPVWIEVALAMSKYFAGILVGTYAVGAGLDAATTAIMDIFNRTSNTGLGTTAIILLSVLIPVVTVGLMAGAGVLVWKRRTRRQQKEVKADGEKAVAADGESPPTNGQVLPPLAEIPETQRLHVSVRPARRPESGDVAVGSQKIPADGISSAERGSYDLGEYRAIDKGKPRSRTSSTEGQLTQKFTVIHPYKPVMGDEMEIKPGDVVSVRLAYDDGYAFGQIEGSGGKAGVFPLACLLPVGLEVGLPSRLESGAMNMAVMQHAPEKVDSLEMLLLSGRITEQTYLALRREQEEELRTQRQITALRERLRDSSLEQEERKKLQRRLDELELGI